METYVGDTYKRHNQIVLHDNQIHLLSILFFLISWYGVVVLDFLYTNKMFLNLNLQCKHHLMHVFATYDSQVYMLNINVQTQ